MNITKFLRLSKKGDINGQSDSGKQQIKIREGSLEENPEVDSIFTNSMDSPECLQILFNCLRNVKKNVKWIHEMKEKTQSSQIKGDLQFNELNETVEFITKKFDQYEEEREKKRKLSTIYRAKFKKCWMNKRYWRNC